MAIIQVYCPQCSGIDVIKYGVTEQGKQRYRCQNSACFKKTFLLGYIRKSYAPGVKEKIVDMVMNGSGIRDTSRVLGVAMNTVMSTLKKRKPAKKRQRGLSTKG